MNMAATSTMAMAMSPTTTGAAAATTSASMSMSMSGGSSCKISMLWNWTVIDSCFISKQWHIRTHGMFAGSCIAVIFLVILLEFLRRAGKEFDRYIVRQAQEARLAATHEGSGAASPSHAKGACAVAAAADADSGDRAPVLALPFAKAGDGMFRPNLWQQAVRATLHLFQFSVAYFVMLLAMYYNGYLIICIFIGAWIGAFIFSWEAISLKDKKEEVTVCCG